MLHPIERRLLAEDLVRHRRADEQLRLASSQRLGRIDPNPHQIDAVVFALRRIPEGGCILADEVGLGKTIEAGLVIAQLLAEGHRRILLIVPKSLLGQWQTELYTLFGIEAREGSLKAAAFDGTGVFLVHRELAGGKQGADLLLASERFDLIVIDEAHEVFAGIHQRFDKEGRYDEHSDKALTAGRVRALIQPKHGPRIPVVLLTATPIQNSLVELWGLVHYVDPFGTLLGKLPTFRELFCEDKDRQLALAQGPELQHRMSSVVQRTLRRQAQDFLEVPFVTRQAKLFEYLMSPAEKQLYDDVTEWLLEPNLCSFRGAQRTLLLLGFHRRMASSMAALVASLQKVVERLQRQLKGQPLDLVFERKSALAFAMDLEEDLADADADDDEVDAEAVVPSPARVQAELQRVESFVQRAKKLPIDSKAERLLDAVRIVQDLAKTSGGDGKLIVFTESLTTQEYLADLLVSRGLVSLDDVTLFRGSNTGPRAKAALEAWQRDVGNAMSPTKRPSKEVAQRLALVHEFRERSKVFISTEAGGKGLNLQFCSTLINYDLPWNPQRIEQRIGRVHRYGQKRGVTVINFIASDNDAQRLTFEILSQKLELFGQVLDASDAVLHVPSTDSGTEPLTSVGDFEKKLRDIYKQANSLAEVSERLRTLRDTVGSARAAYEAEQARASAIIETRLDASLRAVFARYQEELPAGLAKLDHDLDRLMTGYLGALDVAFERTAAASRVVYRLSASPKLPEGYRDGVTVAVGPARDLRDAEPLNLGHALVRAAVEEARHASARRFSVRLDGALPAALASLRGRRGRLVVTKVDYRGIERVEHLIKTVLLEGDSEPLGAAATREITALVPSDVALADTADGRLIDEYVSAAVLADAVATTGGDKARFDEMLYQIERYADDEALVLRREEERISDRLRKAAAKPNPSDEAERVRVRGRREAWEDRLDNGYQSWREDIHQRRFQKPEVTRLLEVDFVIGKEGQPC